MSSSILVDLALIALLTNFSALASLALSDSSGISTVAVSSGYTVKVDSNASIVSSFLPEERTFQ